MRFILLCFPALCFLALCFLALCFLDPRVLDPRVLDPRVLDPRVLDPRVLDPRVLDPRVLDPGTSASGPPTCTPNAPLSPAIRNADGISHYNPRRELKHARPHGPQHLDNKNNDDHTYLHLLHDLH